MASKSAITNAFAAAMSQSVEIPKNGFTSAKRLSEAHAHSFLTPPNSISPSLPPQGFRRHASTPNVLPVPHEVDSEVDLQEGELGHPNIHPATLDSAGIITPAMLAKHYLPEILLADGPLAIRHVMSYLASAVPGFSNIPPAKARRLVVGALEGRGNAGSGGPYNPDVIFEKVGWGRWDARLKGQPPREQNSLSGHPSPPPSAPSSFSNGLAIPGKNQNMYGRASAQLKRWARESGNYSPDDETDENSNEDMNMLEHEADKMSLDGASSSEASDGMVEDDDEGDATDDEDWATVGAEALRKGSVSNSYGNRNYRPVKLPLRYRGGPSSSALAKSSPAVHTKHPYDRPAPGGRTFSSAAYAAGSSERDAIEALVALKSV